MAVEKVIWWQHDSKSGQYSSAKVHRSLQTYIDAGGELDADALEKALDSALPGLKPEIIDGF